MQKTTVAPETAAANVSGTLLEVYEVIDHTIAKFDNAEPKGNELALMLVVAIAETFGGKAFYLPKGSSIKRWLRNKRIYEDWKGGMAHTDLIKKYKLSSAIVYDVITKTRILHKQTSLR